ncbi:MAG: phosphoenolpyruvate mutase [Bacteroidetes bacterium]|nr:phosphoenolpyruvate mutase [Bacteroidota bacterium]
MKTRSLKDILLSQKLEFLMEAHNGISAKIVEEAGFQAIWASSLSISSSFGLRDCNEASWSQVLQTIEYITDSVKIPILMDGDNGYGNYNNVRILVKKLNKLGVQGICIEDQLFPKKNSLLNNVKHELEDINSFCDKIKVAKDHQKNEKFCVVARLEGFIAGYNKNEVIHRAHKYICAGADAILVHSKLNTPSQIIDFMEDSNFEVPVIIVPTTYFKNSNLDLFINLGISAIIWANHNLRASIYAMKSVCKSILENPSDDNKNLASINEVFELTNSLELDSKPTGANLRFLN